MLQTFTRFFLIGRGFILWGIILCHLVLIIPNAWARKEQPTRAPKVWLGPIEPINSEEREKKENWLSRNKWWVTLGGAILAGTVAALTLSGNGESNDSDEDKGTYIIEWPVN